MARAIAAGFENQGVRARLYDLKEAHISEIMTEVVTAKYLCVGSPTLNNSLLPTVAAFLAYLRGLSPKKRVALAFGSYGWGGQSIDMIHEQLAACGFELLEPIKARYVPVPEVLDGVAAKVEQVIAARRK
jgi:flavorubredoxin